MAWGEGEGWRGVWGQRMRTLECTDREVPLCRAGSCVQFAGINHSEENAIKERAWTHITESLCSTAEIITTL